MTGQLGATIVKREIPEAVRREVLRDATGCHYCGDLAVPLLVEHYKPLGRGGDNERDNLVAACVSCNSQKRSMLVHEWRLYRTTHGMPWPPIASHATDPVHYADTCFDCRDAFWDAYPDAKTPEHGFVCKPYELTPDDGRGYVGRYRCPAGHAWRCWWGILGYYSDCPCTFCQISRDDNGDETYPCGPTYDREPAGEAA